MEVLWYGRFVNLLTQSIFIKGARHSKPACILQADGPRQAAFRASRGVPHSLVSVGGAASGVRKNWLARCLSLSSHCPLSPPDFFFGNKCEAAGGQIFSHILSQRIESQTQTAHICRTKMTTMEPQHSKKRKFKEANGVSKKDDSTIPRGVAGRSKKRKESELPAEEVADGAADDVQPTAPEAEDDEPNWEDEDGKEPNGHHADDLADDKNLSLPPAAGTTSDRFADLKLCEKTMNSIEKMGFETMTEIQRRAIPPLLAGKVSCAHAGCFLAVLFYAQRN